MCPEWTLGNLARPARLERATPGSASRCSIQLSYGRADRAIALRVEVSVRSDAIPTWATLVERAGPRSILERWLGYESDDQRVNLAERVGFEPTVGCPTHAFQACAFDRSAISPDWTVGPSVPLQGPDGLRAAGRLPRLLVGRYPNHRRRASLSARRRTLAHEIRGAAPSTRI